LVLAREARARAEQILVKAETFKDADAEQKMREFAEKHVKLAEQLEGRRLGSGAPRWAATARGAVGHRDVGFQPNTQ
jgi:hypothetical protein